MWERLENIDKKGGPLLSHKKNRERNDLVDIWRIFNPSEKRYSWRQKSSAIHCKLDFFYYICWT